MTFFAPRSGGKLPDLLLACASRSLRARQTYDSSLPVELTPRTKTVGQSLPWVVNFSTGADSNGDLICIALNARLNKLVVHSFGLFKMSSRV